MVFVSMPPAVSLNKGVAPEASLDYGQQIHCVVIWVLTPLFDKWRLTDGILLFSWLGVERWQEGASHRANRECSDSMAFNEEVHQRFSEKARVAFEIFHCTTIVDWVNFESSAPIQRRIGESLKLLLL
jgi:hypothetical protein